ncbi:MAG: GTP-binding protein [Halobacteriaceae archaeon]
MHDRLAHDNDISCVEFMGSIGSGKTAILERIIEDAPDQERIGVIFGDVPWKDDARRFRELGVAW